MWLISVVCIKIKRKKSFVVFVFFHIRSKNSNYMLQNILMSESDVTRMGNSPPRLQAAPSQLAVLGWQGEKGKCCCTRRYVIVIGILPAGSFSAELDEW